MPHWTAEMGPVLVGVGIGDWGGSQHAAPPVFTIVVVLLGVFFWIAAPKKGDPRVPGLEADKVDLNAQITQLHSHIANQDAHLHDVFQVITLSTYGRIGPQGGPVSQHNIFFVPPAGEAGFTLSASGVGHAVPKVETSDEPKAEPTDE
jgi:hypothetical protein